MEFKKIFIGVFTLTFLVGIVFTLPLDLFENETTNFTLKVKPKKLVVSRETCNTDYSIYSNAEAIRKLCGNYDADDISANIAVDSTKEKSEPDFEPEILKENNDWREFDGSDFNTKLQEVGEGFHSDQVQVKSGEIWLGLFKNNKGFYLKKSKVKIRRVHDPIVDKEKKQKTGKSVSVKNKDKAIYLLRNARFLSEGKVETIFDGNNKSEKYSDYKELRAGFSKELKIGKETYTFRAKKGVNEKGKKIIALTFENGNKRQVIHSIEYYGDDDLIGTLQWLGDLDRDGKPDFFLSPWIQENTSKVNLYLSSQAQKGKLVKLVATYSTSGC